jgi:hypothetical protein
MKTFEWSVKLDPRTKDAIDVAKTAYPHLSNKALLEAMATTCARLLQDDHCFSLDRPFWHETHKPKPAKTDAGNQGRHTWKR